MTQHENLEILFKTSFKNTIDNYFNRKKVYNYYVNTSNLLRNGYIYTKNYI